MTSWGWRCVAFLLVAGVLLPAAALAQEQNIPILRCDVLPVVMVRIDGGDMRFLLDTAATSTLNAKSFPKGRSRNIHISSWSGTAATSAVEVTLPELAVANHQLKNVKLPAVDLSPIAEACGGKIDGILGIDLLDRMGITIDLQKRIAKFPSPEEAVGYKPHLAMHQAALVRCVGAFNAGNTEELKRCFDPEIVLYTPWGEFHGRDEVVEYLGKRFLNVKPRPTFAITPHEFRVIGDAIWQDYEYSIQSSDIHIRGRGMMVCRENQGKWMLVNMHNSFVQPDTASK